jgi:hypothetical protein
MNISYGDRVVVVQGTSSWFSWIRRDPKSKSNPVLRSYCTVAAGEEWSSRKNCSKVCKNLSLSLYVCFSNLVWLIYLHARSPDSTLQRYYNDRHIVMVSPTVALRYLDQFVKVHACFVCGSEKNFLHQMLSRVAFRGCCDEHFYLSNRLLVGEILVKPI